MPTALAEPVVLAAAKHACYPELDSQTRDSQYAVTDTQFAVESWGEWSIPDAIQSRLQPFNAIRLNSGEPDLLGVGLPDVAVLDADTAHRPVLVVEAKGHNTAPAEADITRGIEQAHARCSEVNLGYVAAPIQSVTDTARSLARDLNVGILGVHDLDTVECVEPACVTGAGDFARDIQAIRFQASTHHLTAGSFPVNHPKNFLGYALALAAEGETRDLYAEYVINEVRGGRRGAILLGLVDDGPEGETLTHLGAEVVRFAKNQSNGILNALGDFADWKYKSTRFTELASRWAQLARAVTMQYEPTQLMVEALEGLHREGHDTVTLPELVARACAINQPLAVEVFIMAGEREAVLTPAGELDWTVLEDPAVYKSGAYFQFKAQLYHVGLITEGGTDDGASALTDEWRLEESVGEE
jgi:hypothetical protein